MKKENLTEYFGGVEPSAKETPRIRCALEFNDQGVEKIANLVFHGMRNGESGKQVVSKQEMRVWTKKIMEKKYPNKEFSEVAFERGFTKLDVDKDGELTVKDIKAIVLNKVKRENLYVGK